MSTPHRTARALTGIAVALVTGGVGVLVMDTPGQADVANSHLSVAEKREQLLAMTSSGASDAEIERKLGLVKVSEGTTDLAPLSSNTDADVNTPSIYYDTGIKLHYVSASYRWNNLATTGDGPLGGGNVGGYDGFGIRFSGDIINYGVSASFPR